MQSNRKYVLRNSASRVLLRNIRIRTMTKQKKRDSVISVLVSLISFFVISFNFSSQISCLSSEASSFLTFIVYCFSPPSPLLSYTFPLTSFHSTLWTHTLSLSEGPEITSCLVWCSVRCLVCRLDTLTRKTRETDTDRRTRCVPTSEYVLLYFGVTELCSRSATDRSLSESVACFVKRKSNKHMLTTNQARRDCGKTKTLVRQQVTTNKSMPCSGVGSLVSA